MTTPHDERHFLDELVRLFDPERIYDRFGGLGEAAFVDELRECHARLSPEEQPAFVQAVSRWMWSRDPLRRMQAIRLCGDLLTGKDQETQRVAEEQRAAEVAVRGRLPPLCRSVALCVPEGPAIRKEQVRGQVTHCGRRR